MINLFKVRMSEDVGNEVVPTLLSGYIGEGDKVKHFENMIVDFIGNKNVVAVNSGTSAIMMALRLAGVGYGDYVITTPMTCLATNEPILALGAKPIFADIDEITGNISAKSVQSILDSHAVYKGKYIKSLDIPIKAIIGMHWGGYPCNAIELQRLASSYKIKFVEDAAQAFGAELNGIKIGCTGSDFTCFSFQAIKHLTTGDGGAIVMSSSKMKKRAELMKWFGLDRTCSLSMRCVQDPDEYGYKFQMNDITASIGIANFKHLADSLEASRHCADEYYKHLNADVGLQHSQLDVNPSYWLYTIRVDDAETFIQFMSDNGIECSKVHARNDTKQMFKLESSIALKGVDYFDKHHVCIPCGWWLSKNDINYVIDKIKEYNNG